MRVRLGSVNLALLSIYFAPVWGIAAARALISPYHGLEERAHAAVAIYFQQLFGVGFNGLILTSHVLAGVKLVIAAAFVAYAIEFARALATGRDADRETVEVVLTLAVIGIVLWALPALAVGDGALVRLCATQMLMVAGAVLLVVVERHIEMPKDTSRAKSAVAERDAPGLAVPGGVIASGPAPAQAAAALARIPEARLRNPASAA